MAYMAIETKFLGATNYKGSRIKAYARDSFSNGRPVSVIKPYQYDLNAEENHEETARTLLPLVCNDPSGVNLYNGATATGYIFVIVQKEREEL